MTANGHELSTKSPSYLSSLVRAACSCGWEGPARDFYRNATAALNRLDGAAHLREVSPAPDVVRR